MALLSLLTGKGLEDDLLVDVQTEWDSKISLALLEVVAIFFSE